jgi:hypothetical protein
MDIITGVLDPSTLKIFAVRWDLFQPHSKESTIRGSNPYNSQVLGTQQVDWSKDCLPHRFVPGSRPATISGQMFLPRYLKAFSWNAHLAFDVFGVFNAYEPTPINPTMYLLFGLMASIQVQLKERGSIYSAEPREDALWSVLIGDQEMRSQGTRCQPADSHQVLLIAIAIGRKDELPAGLVSLRDTARIFLAHRKILPWKFFHDRMLGKCTHEFYDGVPFQLMFLPGKELCKALFQQGLLHSFESQESPEKVWIDGALN